MLSLNLSSTGLTNQNRTSALRPTGGLQSIGLNVLNHISCHDTVHGSNGLSTDEQLNKCLYNPDCSMSDAGWRKPIALAALQVLDFSGLDDSVGGILAWASGLPELEQLHMSSLGSAGVSSLTSLPPNIDAESHPGQEGLIYILPSQQLMSSKQAFIGITEPGFQHEHGRPR